MGVSQPSRTGRARREVGLSMKGRAKFRKWAQQRDSTRVEVGPRQSSLGGRQTKGITHLQEDQATNTKRYERSEAFLHQARESFPED
jgi:hypothetical protein